MRQEKRVPCPIRRGLRWLGRGFCVASMVFFGAFLVLGYSPIGKSIAERMCETPAIESLAPADAIVVLGGDPYRAVTAAGLYHKGLARRVIVSADSERMLHTLKQCGVPARVVEVEELAGITSDHPRTIQTLPGITPKSRLILVTSKLHPARVRMIFAKAGYANFQVYSQDSQWGHLYDSKPYIGAFGGIQLMYELLAYCKDWSGVF